jgi:hypothetical protein
MKMTLPSDVDNEVMVPCQQCSNQVWVRKDRLQMHLQKVHSPKAAPRKSFTTYQARIASSYPPKVKTKATTVKPAGLPKAGLQLSLTSRAGQRVGRGFCSECGLEQPFLWHYSESNQGAVELCGGCKSIVFERSFG